MKKHILNIIVLILLLGGISSCYFVLFPTVTILYDTAPVNKDERLVYMQELIDIIEDGITQQQKKIDIRAFRCDERTLKEVMVLTSFSNPLCVLYTQDYRVIMSAIGYVKYIVLDYSAENKVKYIENEMTSITSTMDDGLSDLEKVIWINNYICKNYQYDYGLSHDDVFEMLGTKKGMCGAYTQMFTLLANEAGLQTSFAISFTMQHVWNIVQVDGCWYNIDVTWNDQSYTYCYLTSDEAMLSFHSYQRSAEDTIQFIVCNDTRYDRVQLSGE